MWEYYKKFLIVLLVIGFLVGFVVLCVYGRYYIATSDLDDWVKFALLT